MHSPFSLKSQRGTQCCSWHSHLRLNMPCRNRKCDAWQCLPSLDNTWAACYWSSPGSVSHGFGRDSESDLIFSQSLKKSEQASSPLTSHSYVLLCTNSNSSPSLNLRSSLSSNSRSLESSMSCICSQLRTLPGDVFFVSTWSNSTVLPVQSSCVCFQNSSWMSHLL